MNKTMISIISVVLLLIVVIIISATTGSIKVGSWELVQGLITGTNKKVQVIKDLRMPRIIIASFVGAALAVSGCCCKQL